MVKKDAKFLFLKLGAEHRVSFYYNSLICIIYILFIYKIFHKKKANRKTE